MAYLYTAQALGGRAVQHPEFVKRDIKMTIGQLENQTLVGIPEVRQRAYNGYIANLPAFLHATMNKKRTSCARPYYNITVDTKDIIPFRLPPIAVCPIAPMVKDEDKTKFQKTLPGNITMTKYINRDVFLMSGLTPSTIEKIPFSTCDVNVPSPPEAMNLTAITSLMLTLKIITAFLGTHTYPAFSNELDEDNITVTDYFLDPVWKKSHNFTLSRSKTRGEDENDIVDKKDWEDLKDPEMDRALLEYFDGEPKYSHQGVNLVNTAKPSPFYPTLNYGRPQELPTLPGYILPHFNLLHEPSENVIINVMRRYFIQALTTKSEDASTFREWKRGVHLWYRTDIGKWISHIMYALQATLEAQGRLYIFVQNGLYMGSAILGYGLHLLFDKVKVSRADHEETRDLAIGLDRHTKAIDTITKLLSELTIRGSEAMPVQIEPKMTCMREVFKEVNRREKLDGEDLRILIEEIGHLTFVERFWPMAVDKLTEALRLMFVDTDESLDGLPMHIVPGTIYNESRVNQVLSVFGPMSPSFLDNGGNWVSIPKSPEDADPLSTRADDGLRPLEFILVTGKKLDIAVQDMDKVVQKRAIKQNASERASGYRTLKFTNEARNRLWNSLKLIPVVKSDKGKKRSTLEEEEDPEGGPSKKAKLGKSGEGFDPFNF